MKVPLSWLNEYVKVDDVEPKELAEKLTRAGLQVESIETVGGTPLSDLIVVVEVLDAQPHPNSDHLQVCKVTDGTAEYQVVCGAPNMRKGIKTAFAKIGALIPEGEFKIKKGKLRGVESNGMCCSERELHVGEGAAGIIEYPPETPTGALVRDVARLEKPETVFDIEITWNRPDALSVVGIAREYAAILHRELKLPPVDFVETDTPVESEVKVVVEDPVKCPRYTALHRARRHRDDARRAEPRVDGEAAGALRRPLAGPRGGRHQLRDAGARPAAARVRPHEAQGPHDCRARRA